MPTVVTLRDGTRIRVRDLEPGDRDRLVEGFEGLSPTARLMRFGREVPDLTPSMLDRLMDVDGHDHVALVAVDEDDPSGPGLGIARFVREPYDTWAAEAAVTVAEGNRGRGIGTALLVALGERAVREGVTELRNYVLAENTAMREVFADLGATTAVDGGRIVRLDLPLDAPLPAESHAARVLRTAASGST
jgi:GNAT superfamily N-acetyltransferase